MSSTSSETEVFTTPPSSPSGHSICFQQRTPIAPTFIAEEFDTATISQPRKALGICCSARDVWYSNRYWPEHKEFTALFSRAAETRNKFEPEFRKVWNSRGKRFLSTMPFVFELRMAGVRDHTSRQILLQSSIWIRTTDAAVHDLRLWKKLQKEVRKLGLDAPQYAPIYAESGLMSANDTVTVAKDKLSLEKGIKFSESITLHAHVSQQPGSESPCGRIFLISIVEKGEIVHQTVTSGHVILDYFLKRDQQRTVSWLQLLTGYNEEAELTIDSDSESDDEYDVELIENDDRDPVAIPATGQWDPKEQSLVWLSVVPHGAINFVDQVELQTTWFQQIRATRSRLSIPADFALISGPDYWQKNEFRGLRGFSKVSGVVWDHRLFTNGREVGIILNPMETTVSGILIPTQISFAVGGTTIPCTKICLDTPLSLGTSGAWVIDKTSNALCGAIIAIAAYEPFAFMVTAERLLLNITQYSKVATVVRVPMARGRWGYGGW
ncbi:hypothetical protein FHETE_6376 [Fusarium heterosporum]|uniref:Uncharacterized protein n=1 Tax=Fusarium heterosporum TaxID=42747 RepID=A0A8H5TBD1_FUSHE|nr:hypothetical protein FHETE_6376 [Fusarium heterosporum]